MVTTKNALSIFKVVILVMVAGLFTNQLSLAETVDSANYQSNSLSSLIQYGREHSLNRKSNRLEVKSQEATARVIDQQRVVPKIDLTASFTQNYYDRLRDDGTGRLISNNGQSPLYSLTVAYDLQKLFGPESSLANQSIQNARVQERIGERDLIRSVKKSFFIITEIKAEIIELERLITLFAKIDGILTKQKRMGLYNEIERQQFKAQQSILESDLQTKRSDLDSAYFQLSSSLNTDLADVRKKVDLVTEMPQLHFAERLHLSPEEFLNTKDSDILQSLSKDYNLTKMEYEQFHSTPLPTLYIKGSRLTPSMPSSDGPQTSAEIGISIPIDGLVIRAAQKSQLGARTEKAQAVFEQTLLDYRNQVRQNVFNLERYKNQKNSLERARMETKKLLDKAFLFYSQKRIDVLGTLDIFQKYLQASRNSLVNDLQIASVDTELEYLIGGGGK